MRCFLVCLMLSLAATAHAEDALGRIERSLAAANCCQFRFLSVVESEVFGTVDTATGEACLAQDGRYAVTIGDDLYVYDKEFLRSYSASQNQVTVERVSPEAAQGEEISFVTHLSDYYHIKALKPDREYALIRIDSVATGVPDSLRVFVSKEHERLDSLRYLDSNGDLNHVIILSHRTLPDCSGALLSPAIPDSAEVIKLY